MDHHLFFRQLFPGLKNSIHDDNFSKIKVNLNQQMWQGTKIMLTFYSSHFLNLKRQPTYLIKLFEMYLPKIYEIMAAIKILFMMFGGKNFVT